MQPVAEHEFDKGVTNLVELCALPKAQWDACGGLSSR